MYSQSFLVTSVRGRAFLPTTAASSLEGVSAFMNPLVGAASSAFLLLRFLAGASVAAGASAGTGAAAAFLAGVFWVTSASCEVAAAFFAVAMWLFSVEIGRMGASYQAGWLIVGGWYFVAKRNVTRMSFRQLLFSLGLGSLVPPFSFQFAQPGLNDTQLDVIGRRIAPDALLCGAQPVDGTGQVA